ncbi:glycerophosphodiester phosphodiesterase family protein [Streptosporangium sp. NPDC003464]
MPDEQLACDHGDHGPRHRRGVDQAHSLGIKVIPWTVDDVPTMNKLIDDGVDGMITDYPDRLRPRPPPGSVSDLPLPPRLRKVTATPESDRDSGAGREVRSINDRNDRSQARLALP